MSPNVVPASTPSRLNGTPRAVIEKFSTNGMDPSPLYGIECQTGAVRIPVTNGERSKMKLTRVRVDLAKNIFQLHGVDRVERPV